MKRTTAIAAAALLLAGASTSFAQSRDFGARRIIFDDGITSFETRVEATSPMTASGTFTLPDPGVAFGTFIMSNSFAGQSITGGLTNNTFLNANGVTTIGNGVGTLNLNLNGSPNATLTESGLDIIGAGNTTFGFTNTGAGNLNLGTDGNFTAGTGITSTLGNITATAGNFVATAGGYMTGATMRIANNGDATLSATTTTSLTASGAAALNGTVNLGNGDADAVVVNTTGNFLVTSDDFTIDVTGNTVADGLLTGGLGLVASTGNINAVTGNLQTNTVTRIANNGDATLQATTTTSLTASGAAALNGTVNIGNGDADAVVLNTTGNFTVASDDFTVDAVGNVVADGLLTGGLGVVATTGNINAIAGGLQTNTVTRIDNSGNATLGTASVTGQITSTLANGTAPFVLTSSTVSPNLNADMVDGLHGTDLVTLAGNQTITGIKTFPVNAGQGDAFINSINAGTGFIDWGRIGTAGGELGVFTFNTAATQTIPQALVEANRVIVVTNNSGSSQQVDLPAITKMGHTIAIMRAATGDAIDIKDNATQQLSNDYNNMGAYDVLTVLWDGSDWVEMSRSNN
jgi:hypothetical protein